MTLPLILPSTRKAPLISSVPVNVLSLPIMVLRFSGIDSSPIRLISGFPIVLFRVNGFAVNAHLVMDMRRSADTGIARERQRLSKAHRRTGRDQQRVVVSIH